MNCSSSFIAFRWRDPQALYLKAKDGRPATTHSFSGALTGNKAFAFALRTQATYKILKCRFGGFGLLCVCDKLCLWGGVTLFSGVYSSS